MYDERLEIHMKMTQDKIHLDSLHRELGELHSRKRDLVESLKLLETRLVGTQKLADELQTSIMEKCGKVTYLPMGARKGKKSSSIDILEALSTEDKAMLLVKLIASMED